MSLRALNNERRPGVTGAPPRSSPTSRFRAPAGGGFSAKPPRRLRTVARQRQLGGSVLGARGPRWPKSPLHGVPAPAVPLTPAAKLGRDRTNRKGANLHGGGPFCLPRRAPQRLLTYLCSTEAPESWSQAWRTHLPSPLRIPSRAVGGVLRCSPAPGRPYRLVATLERT